MTPQEALERLEAAEKARMQEGGRWEPDWQDAVELLYKATLPLIAVVRVAVADHGRHLAHGLVEGCDLCAALSALVAAVGKDSQ